MENCHYPDGMISTNFGMLSSEETFLRGIQELTSFVQTINEWINRITIHSLITWPRGHFTKEEICGCGVNTFWDGRSWRCSH